METREFNILRHDIRLALNRTLDGYVPRIYNDEGTLGYLDDLKSNNRDTAIYNLVKWAKNNYGNKWRKHIVSFDLAWYDTQVKNGVISSD